MAACRFRTAGQIDGSNCYSMISQRLPKMKFPAPNLPPKDLPPKISTEVFA
jgi:hypothetical protein